MAIFLVLSVIAVEVVVVNSELKWDHVVRRRRHMRYVVRILTFVTEENPESLSLAKIKCSHCSNQNSAIIIIML